MMGFGHAELARERAHFTFEQAADRHTSTPPSPYFV
jgi:hypothetical protein